MEDSYSYTELDFFYTPILLIIILFIGYLYHHKKRQENELYKYYFPGLLVKVIGSIIFFFVYTLYYGYGDTVDYLKGSYSMSGLFLRDFQKYYSAFTGITSWGDAWCYFDNHTTYPPYFMWKDENTRAVVNITSIINLIGLRASLPTTVILAALSYLGVWKLFLFFSNFFPHLEKKMAIAVLFFPSLVFWGSGVMKDTYTFAALSWLVYNLFMIFIKRRKLLLNILLALINALIIIKIKPYILVALIPGIIVWLLFNPISRIKNKVLAFSLMPIIITFAFIMILMVFASLQGLLGQYNNIDQAVQKAKIIQEDLKRSEQYGTNYYDIGKIDGTYSGMIKVAPMSIIAGMYRPFLWEARNPVMLISGLENLFLLLMTIFLIIRLKFFRFFQFLFSHPILIFSVLFTILFMFAVGMASANFGALVRYKIPAIPFFVASVFIMLDKYKNHKESLEKKMLNAD